MREIVLRPEAEEIGMRLDLFLVKRLNVVGIFLSRNSIQRLIKEKKVSSPQINSLKPHYKIKSEDIFKVLLEATFKTDQITPEPIPLKIIYEDEALAIIDKPTGLVVHPGAGNLQHTLVNALLYHFKELSQINPQRPGIVHRLDKDTSGIMVIAKTNNAHLDLMRQFSQHLVKKEYIAIVKGCMEFDEDILELPIRRNMRDRRKQWIGFAQNSRYAKTGYKTLLRQPDASLVKLIPFTGRTHQLRVHLAFIGHPILGDTKYGKDRSFERLALHAYSLGFNHPTKKNFVEFKSSVPQEFLSYFNLNKLKI